MLRTFTPKFNPEAQYVLAKSMTLGSCREIGEAVSIQEVGERRARQSAEQFIILPTHVQVVRGFDLADGRRLKAGEVIASEELGAGLLKRYLGLKLQPVPPPAAKITPAAAGKGKTK